MKIYSISFFMLFFIVFSMEMKSQRSFTISPLVEYKLSKAYSNYNPPAIVKDIDSLFINDHIKRLTENRAKIFTNRFNGNTIVLSVEELNLIIDSLESFKNLEWHKDQFPDRATLNFDEMSGYLAEYNNTVVIMNEPIYFRDDQFALFFFSNLCCGMGIGGYVQFAFYKKVNNNWTEFIEISGGDF